MKKRRFDKGDTVYFPAWDGEKGYVLPITIEGFHGKFVKYHKDGSACFAEEEHCFKTAWECRDYIDGEYKAFLISQLVSYGQSGRK